MASRQSKATLTRGRATTLVLAVALFCGSFATPVQAAPIGVTYNMDVSLIAGVDTLGLHGASMSLTILFDTADTYTGADPFPYIFATSDSLTISDASVAGSNGTFSSNAGIRFFPTFGGQYFAAGGFATYSVGSVPLVLGRLADLVPGVLVGDLIDASHFGTTPFTTAENPGCNWCASNDTNLFVVTDSRYSVTNFSATAVPEPATLTLLGLGLLGLAGARRRRT